MLSIVHSEVATRLFSPEDQTGFANLSGDFNPIHLDSVVARRSPAGAPIVHGVHAVLWALDELIHRGILVPPIATIEARFLKVIYVGTPVSLRVTRVNGTSMRAELWTEALRAVVVTVGLGQARSEQSHPYAETMDEIDAAPIARAFPEVARALGTARTAAIAQLSALVGMLRPGLYSMLGDIKVKPTAESGVPLSFSVRKVDERFRMVELGVSGSGITATVTAFRRHPPIEQRSFAEIRRLVQPGEYAAASALIIGGSRGLGAVTAKLLSAGGARVMITYAAGEDDARKLCAEIGGARCRAIRYDVLTEPEPQLAAIDQPINQLYYFATPHIGRQEEAEFRRYYVDGFEAIFQALRARGDRDLSVFYPSSLAVELPVSGMVEYAAAKAAGEKLCARIARAHPGPQVIVKRLPRILTDLTASLMQQKVADAVDIMLPIVREMQVLCAQAPRRE
jgi:acyl dehydratase/NAD(P)-dependent dehydrogenase (short-subunit alcohol dehydrogenase family)